METRSIAHQNVVFHYYNTVIVGSGAAGMNCAVHLYELMSQKGIENAQQRIVVVTAGLGLGASRMSGSDKQTYYKIGTSPDVPDSAEEFAKSLTAAGCCHADLAMAEAVGSLREFYHLVQLGVPFPSDSMGSFVGYKTDHDPFERATSAGPTTSRLMCECLHKQVERYGIRVLDGQEVVHLLSIGAQDARRIVAVVTLDQKSIAKASYAVNVYLGENIVLAAGGPGGLYRASVYPEGQLGLHGLAFRAGLIGENLTESQFGLASLKFRWNVSGTYMQAIPRIFSTDGECKNEREFLAGFFETMGSMATSIFLKGYQWPFDPQRIRNGGSSLIDLLVFNETQNGRRVFMDFLHNPLGRDCLEDFNLQDLQPEAHTYLQKAGALQERPIDRLAHMNPLAVEIYKDHGIDLHAEPLEIALCAQHNNGGFAVDKWWQSNIPHTFVIGEMAGTHGVKRPGGSALNAGQVGGLRAAQYIVNVYGCGLPDHAGIQAEIHRQVAHLITRLEQYRTSSGPPPAALMQEIQVRMTASGGHVRRLSDARAALKDAVRLYVDIQRQGIRPLEDQNIIQAIQAEHLALTSIAFLKAIVTLLEQGGGSRGSHLVLADDGIQVHPDIVDRRAGGVLRFKPENESLRNTTIQIQYDNRLPDLFHCRNVSLRSASTGGKAFEPAWRDYREGKIYST